MFLTASISRQAIASALNHYFISFCASLNCIQVLHFLVVRLTSRAVNICMQLRHGGVCRLSLTVMPQYMALLFYFLYCLFLLMRSVTPDPSTAASAMPMIIIHIPALDSSPVFGMVVILFSIVTLTVCVLSALL